MVKNKKKTLKKTSKYRDVIRFNAVISPNFMERIRILFGKKIVYGVEIKTQFRPGKMESKDECYIEKIFNRKKED